MPDPIDLLLAAIKSSDELNHDSPSSSVTAPCPTESRQVIEAHVSDNTGAPLPGVIVQLDRHDRSIAEQVTDSNGLARFDGLVGGTYRLSLPRIDPANWGLRDRKALVGAGSVSRGNCAWLNVDPEIVGLIEHRVQAHECINKIAVKYGIERETIWADGRNESLALKRNGNILDTSDVVVVRKGSVAWISADLGQRHLIVHTPPQAELIIRFLDENGDPQALCAYLLRLHAEDMAPIPMRTNRTDEKGFLIEQISPLVSEAQVTLFGNDGMEVHSIVVSGLRPIENDEGVAQRLANLGFACWPGSMDDRTVAIAEFQSLHRLSVTGVADPITRAEIIKAHLS